MVWLLIIALWAVTGVLFLWCYAAGGAWWYGLIALAVVAVVLFFMALSTVRWS